MSTFKRFLSLVVALVMVIGMVPATVFATGEETPSDPPAIDDQIVAGGDDVAPDEGGNDEVLPEEGDDEEAAPEEGGEPDEQAEPEVTEVTVATLAELQAALAAENDLPIVITKTIEIPAGEEVTLDLRGKMITSGYQTGSDTKHLYPLDVYGNLTIQDSVGNGSITGRGIYVREGSELTVKSGAIYGIDSNGGSALWQYGGDIVIDGGHIEQKAEGTYNFAINAGAGTVTVNGGWIGGNHGAIAAGGAAVVINGGELVCTGTAGMTDNVLYSYETGSITINGGTFVADKDTASGGCCIYDANGKTTVNGGNFSNSSGGDVWGTTDTAINGGTFENLIETSHVAVGATIVNGGKTYTKDENGQMVEAPAYVAQIGEQGYMTLEEAFAAAVEGETITLLADATPALTSQRAITKAAVIDLGGKTLTLTEDDLYFGTTTFENGTIVVDSSVKPSTAVFWMFADQTLTFDNVKIVATGVTGTYLIGLDGNNSDLNLLNGSEIFINNETALDLDVICVNASTGNDIVINNSKVTVTNLDGRVFFRGNYTVKGASDIDLSGITKAGFRIEAGQTLTIADTATVDIVGEPRDGGIHLTDATATYTKADTATVNATVNAPAVAAVNGTEYATLSEAVAAAKAGDEIVLLADVTENVTVPTGVIFNGNGKQVNGTLTAGGDLTFKGKNTVSSFSAGYYNHTITIGEDASLKVTSGRVTVSYGNVFNITGTIENAKTAANARALPQASLIVPGGLSFNGNGGGVQFNVTNAYVVLGDSSTKNSGATGEFNMNFTNSIVDFTKTLKTYMPTVAGLAPEFNFAAKDSVIGFASHMELWLDNTTMTLDNTDLTVGGSFANAGEVNVTNESNFVVKAPIMSSHGGNTGAITVSGGTFELVDSNEDWQNAGTMTATGTGKLVTNDFKNVGEGELVLASATASIVGKADLGITTEITNGTVKYDEATKTYIVELPDVAQVGSTKYKTIDEAIAAWTNNTTLTLLADVQLSDVIKLKSTENHTLNLGTYTMTAASGKNAIEITCEGRSSASYALTVNADATNPGGINAPGKACIYYSKTGSTKDRPIIRIYNGVFNGSYSINSKSNGNTNCPQIWIYGGTFNGNVNLTKNMLRVFGGTFNGWINCTGDSSAYREISGGRFKSWQFMTADADSKFWVGTSKANYNVGCYIDDEGYLVVGGDVVTEAGDKFEASSANYGGWSSYLKYSSAKDNGLYYTSAKEAFADNNKTTGSVTVYADELDMTGISYKGTIVIPDGKTLSITGITDPAALQMASTAEGKTVVWTANDDGSYTYDAIYAVAKIGDTYYESLAEAVAAIATDGSDTTIKLLTDIELTDSIVFNYGTGKVTFTADEPVTVKQTKVGLDLNISVAKAAQFVIGENVTFEIYDNASGMYVYYGPSLTLNGTITGGQNWGCLYLFNGEHTVTETGKIGVGRVQLASNETTVEGEVDTNYLLVEGATFTADGAKVDANVIFDNNNGSQRWGASQFAIKNGSEVTTNKLTLSYADSTLTIDTSSSLAAAEIAGNGKIIIDGANFAGNEWRITGNASNFAGTIEIINNPDLKYVIDESGNIVVKTKNYVAQIGEQKFESLEEAFAAAKDGETITLLKDATPALTSQRAITKAAVIDLGGKTLTLTEDDLYFGTTTFKNGTIVVDPSVKPSTAVFWMFANQTLTFDNVKIVATGVTGTYLIGLEGTNCDLNLLNGSEIVIENTTALDLDVICVNGSADNDIVIDNSKVTVTNLDGRVFFNGNYTVKGNSVIELEGITKAGFRILAGQTLSIEDATVVTIVGEPRDGGIHLAAPTAIYTKDETATVNATIKKEAYKVSTKAELDAALAAAKEGDTILLTADIDYGTAQLAIAKAITLDLGGKTLTTRNAFGGMSVKGNPTVKNGTIVHASNTAAIKVWNATAFEDLVIDVQGKGDANKTIGGIVLQSGSTTRVGSIKNVTIKGAALTNGIETYNCGDATENVIGSMENVKIDALGTGMLISAPCGTATNCTVKGGVNAIEIFIKGNYSASLTLESSKVEGRVHAHDEFNSNPDIVNNGTLSLTVDEATTGVSADTTTLTINHAKEDQVKGEVLETIIDNAQAKVNGTYYKTLAEAMKAAKDGDTVTILAGTYDYSLNVNKAITVIGEGDVTLNGVPSIKGTNYKVENIDFVYGTGSTNLGGSGLIKNCSFTATAANGNTFRYCYGTKDAAITFEGCTLNAPAWAIHFDSAPGMKLTLTNCEINGRVALGGDLGSLTATGTSFENGYVNVWGTEDAATFTECEFVDVPYIFTGYDADNVVNFNKCGDTVIGLIYGGNDSADAKIYIDGVLVSGAAKIGNAYYQTLEEAFAAAQNGDEVVVLKAGTYKLGVSGKNITVTGAVDGVVFDNIGAYGLNGASVTFNNVTFDYYPNVNYTGLQHSGNLVYNECTFNGQVFLYGQSETFNKCTFNQNSADAYNVWTYGAEEVAFNECIFNSVGKSVLVYTEDANHFIDVSVEDTKFNASAAVDGKAAIEIDTSLTAGATITVANTTATGFGTGNVSGNSLWNNKKGSNTDTNNDITVVVNGETVLAPVTFVAYIGEIGYTDINTAVKAAVAGDTVTIKAGTYTMPSVKAGITIEGDGEVLLEGTLSGTLENLTLKNLHIKGGNAQRWAYAKGNLVFENVTFEATGVYAVHFDGITAGTTLKYKDCTIIGWAAMSGSPESCVFEGCTFKGNGSYGLIRTYFDATIEDCTFDVANVNTNDIYQDGIHAVSGAIVTVNNCTNVNGNMTDVINVSDTSVVKLDGVNIQNVAKIGDNYYGTLDAAFASAKSDDTITMLIDGALTKEVVLDGTTLTVDGSGKLTLDDNLKVKGETTLNITAPMSGEVWLDDGAIVVNSNISGDVFVAGNVTFRGANSVNMLYDYGTLTDNYGTVAPMQWTVEKGASLTVNKTARYGLGYGDKVTIIGNLTNAKRSITPSLFMHGLVAQESKGWNCDSSFTVKDAYVVIGQNNSFGNKPGNYGGTYTFTFENARLDASRITFYEALSTTNFSFTDSNVKTGTFMTNDADSVFTLTNTKLLSTTTSNGTDEGNYNAGILKLTNSELTYSAAVTNKGTIEMDVNSILTAPAITGAGKIVIDATGYTGSAKTIIAADLSGYTGTIEVKGAVYQVTAEGIVVDMATAIVGEYGYASVQAAIDACVEGDNTVTILKDTSEDVTILQKEGVNITIDGAGKTFSGTMNVHGGSNYGSDTLTIQNVQFETTEAGHDFIWSDSQNAPARYAHNVTVKDCDFSAAGSGKNTAVGLRFRQAKNIQVIDCTAFGLHSLMQVNSSSKIVLDNASIVTCKNGASFAQSDDVTVKNSYIKAVGETGYGIRGEGYTGYTLNVENCDVSAYIPVLVRKTTGADFTLNVSGDNTMKASNTFGKNGAACWAVICTNDASDADPVAPSVDFNLNVTGNGLDILAVYPGFVASIGTEMYRTLAEAMAEAEAGDTIKLLTDITLDQPIAVAKDLTIDGGNHTLTYTGTDRAITVENTANGADLTVKNLKIDALKANRGINYNTTGELTVENVIVTIGENVDGYAINLPGSADGAIVNITNSDLTARNPLNIWGNDTVINIVDTDITSVDNSETYFYSAIQLNNDTYGNAAEGTVVTVTGGSITALDEKGEASFAVTNWTETGIVNISDTTVVNGNINNIVAWIGGAGFPSLQSALNSQFNGTIKILRDFAVSEAINVPAGKKATIDLNGKTITGTDNATASFGLINVQPGAELTINDTKGTGKITLIANNDRNWNAYSSVISNQRGKLTVNGGTIEHLGGTDMAYGIDNLTNGKGTYAETIINGGTVKSTYRAIRQFLNGTEAQNILTVNGGTIEGANKSIWMQEANSFANPGKLTVKAEASLNGDVLLSPAAGAKEWPVEVSIAADALKGTSTVLTNENVPAGYDVAKVGDTWGVMAGYAAKIGTQYYATLQAAIDACVAGDNTITLLAASAEDVTVKQAEGVNITIDGANKTYSGTITIHGAARSAGAETLTIQNMKFETSEAGHYFIDSNSTASAERYAHNVTVTGSTFTATGEAINSAAAMRIRQGFNIAIDDVTATGMHSLLQAYGNNGVTINKVTVNGKNGISAGTSTGVVITNANITATTGYGIRADGTGAYDMTVKNSTIKANDPIVVRKNTAEGYKLALENNTLTPTNADGYHVVFTKGEDATYVAPDGKPVITGAEGLNVFPVGVAKIGNTYYATLQAAIDACVAGDNTITLLADSAEDVTVKQAEGVNIVIDGANKTYSGTITIHGAARFDGAETLTIQNVKFETSEAGHYFIDSNSTASAERYAHNVTVTGSTFTATGAAIDSAAAMRIRQGFNIAIDDVTATGMHSLFQGYGVAGLSIDGVKATDMKNGISAGTSTNVSIKNVEIEAAGYGIRADGTVATELKVSDSNINAAKPIVVRKNSNADYAVALENNTLTGGEYDVIFTTGSDDEALVAPTHAVNVEGAENLKVFPVHVAKIGESYFTTFAKALEAVQDGDTITLIDGAKGDESKTEIEFNKDIEFTITGNAPEYALPVITFQNATVNIKDAEILIPELDARQNATINVIDSIVHDAGGNSIVKSYYNGAINISGNSVVHTMQVTTMGYITVSGTAELNATWQTNVYGNGMITVKDDATFATAALHLTGKDYSGRDNTDADRVGKPATIVVDGAELIVGKVTSDNGADYSYNSSKGINIGTEAGKNAVLDIKDGATVKIYMGNGETANIGAGGTVNVNGTMTVACRAENGTATLVNNGSIVLKSVNASVTANECGNVTTDVPGDYKVVYADGAYKVVEKVYVAQIGENGQKFESLSEAIEAANGGDTITFLADINENVVVKKNLTIEGAEFTYTGKMTVNTDLTVTVQNVNFVKGYIYENKGPHGKLTVMNCDFDGVDKSIDYAVTMDGGDSVTMQNCTAKNYYYGMLYAPRAVTSVTVQKAEITDCTVGINITRGVKALLENVKTENVDYGIQTSNFAAKNITIRNCELDGNHAICVYDRDTGIIDTFIFEGKNIVNALDNTGNAKYVLANKDATLTAPEGATVTTNVADHKVVYENGTYKVVAKHYVAQIGDVKYEKLSEAIKAANGGDTITFLADIEENVTVNKNVTIDGAKFKYTGVMKMDKEMNVTVKNVNFVKGCIETTKSSKNKLTVKNCDFDGAGTIWYAVTMRGGTSVTMENCTAKHYMYDMLYVPSSVTNVVVKDTEATECRIAVNVAYGSKITLENVKTSAVEYGIQTHDYGAKTITIRNCDLEGNYSVFVWARDNGKKTTDTFIFEGKNIIRTLPTEYAKLVLNPVDGKIEEAILITPEVEGLNITTTTAGYQVVYDTAAYKLVEKDFVAQIGDTKYESLNEAIEAAKDGDTVKVIADHQLDEQDAVTIPNKTSKALVYVDKDITIDLNGHNLTANVPVPVMFVFYSAADAEVEITGAGSVNATGNGLYYMFSNGGKMTISGGDYTFNGINQGAMFYSYNSNMTVTGGKFTQINSGWMFNADKNGAYIITVSGGTFNRYFIGGGEYGENLWGEVVLAEGKALVESSIAGYWTIDEAVAKRVDAEGKNIMGYATLADAIEEFKAGETIVLLKDNNESLAITGNVIVDVNGYDYTGTITLAAAEATLTAVENLNVVTNLENYKVVYADGAHKVVPYVYVAQVGDTKYESLQDAIDAAQDGETVKLISNIDIKDAKIGTMGAEKYSSYFVVAGKTITVDLNGNFITGTYTGKDMLVGVFSTADYGHLTLTGNGTVDIEATVTNGKSNVYALIASYEPDSSIIIQNGTYTLDAAIDCLLYSQTNEGMIVNDGNFTLGNVGTGNNGQPWIFNVKGQNAGHVVVNGGTFNADVNHQFWANEVKLDETKALKNNGDGTWTVVDAVAYVEEKATSTNSTVRKVGYATLQDTINAADGKTVTLLQDTAENLTITGKVVIDQDGNEITGKITLADAEATLTAEADLDVVTEIKDSFVVYKDGTYRVKKAVAKIGETLYAYLDQALQDADKMDGNPVVELLTSVDMTEERTDGVVIIPSGVTLDIKAFTLTANYIIGVNGSMLNATPMLADGKPGRLKVAENNLILSEVGPNFTMKAGWKLVPLWDEATGSYFYAPIEMRTKADEEHGLFFTTNEKNENVIEFYFRHLTNTIVKDNYVKNGSTKYNFNIIARVEWDLFDDEGNKLGTANQDFVYSDYFVTQVATSTNMDYVLKIAGYESIGITKDNVRVTPMIITECGLEICGTTYYGSNVK